LENIKKKLSLFWGKTKKLYSKHPNYFIYAASTIAVLTTYLLSTYLNREERIYHQKENVSFAGARTVSVGSDYYQMKDKVNERRMKKLEIDVKLISESLQKISEKLNEPQSQNESKDETQNVQEQTPPPQNDPSVSFDPSPSNLQVDGVQNQVSDTARPLNQDHRKTFKRGHHSGPSTITFPVQPSASKSKMTVKVPAGSYLKAKLLTGVEASESRPVPVLLQADYFFVGPNKTKIDLTGCFIIAKSQGNLSIERVEMQTEKISCVSKSGKMFERSLNGFVADGLDSSFGITGIVNSKQSRVASMAFLSSVVQGVSSAIQQAQTSTQTNTLGGSSSVITGDQAKHMAAGGVSNAASLVTNWYLQHAQNLLPTINVGSGQDVWLVLQDTVDLPNWYFAKPKKQSSQGSFSYLSRLID